MQTDHQTLVAVVGRESMECLRLADVLREVIGRENVFRYLETEHLLRFLEKHSQIPIVVFVDIFSFDLQEVTTTIGEIRVRYPKVMFSLYTDRDEWNTRRVELPGAWSDRLGRYYHLHTVPVDEEFEPIVRHAFRIASSEAQYNFGYEPVRITGRFDAGVLTPEPSPEARLLGAATVFVSYARSDWDGTISPLTRRLQQAGFQLWVDQGFLVGGEDWLDTTWEALNKCRICLLAISPDAIESQYVKMEYRFFFRNNKTIVPVLVRPVSDLPPELAGIHYIDFTIEDTSNYDKLHQVLAQSVGA